ncbi:hypothetical protein NDU88_006330 [Pleurodeles waltl]|uniref:Uncharacterized protein n=1 Tax=Pleurodeles waltl TaxID=8319 RepID=A0AAV7PL54_PLEWA|nr:hypothetical protein NDU88_006330 [Pleurodeles waltl]
MLPDQTEGQEVMPTNMQSQFDNILVAIVDTKTALQQVIGAVSVGLGLLRPEHQKMEERMQETERSLADIRPAQEAMMQQVAELIDRVLRLEHRAEDTEGSNIRNNIRVVGLPEGRGNDQSGNRHHETTQHRSGTDVGGSATDSEADRNDPENDGLPVISP